MKNKHFDISERLSLHKNLAFVLGPLWGSIAIFARFAKTAFATGDELTVKHWAAKTFKYGYFNNYFNKFVGRKVTGLKGVMIKTDDNAMICKKTEFQKKKKGDRIRYALIDPLSGEGVIDDERLEDNEEALSSHYFDLTLRRRRHATRSEGEMSDRRPAFDVQAQSRDVLGMWLARIHDRDVIAALSGVANAVGTIAANVPSSTREWKGGQKADGTVYSVATDTLVNSSTNHLFGEKVIEHVHRLATLNEPVIRPIIIGGEEYYIMFIHPYQTKALRATTDYKAALQNAEVRGKGNPLFTGAEGLWGGVIIHTIPWIETRLGAATQSLASEYFDSGDICTSGMYVARALFCGAQAVCIGYGGTPKWVEDKFDYENEWGIALGLFFSVAKTEFNSIDYGVIPVDTAMVAD